MDERLALPAVGDCHTVVLVEGLSDKAALEALARRHGRDLGADGVAVVAMGGAQAIGRFLELFGPRGRNLGLAGLCDAPEEADFKRGLERAGLGTSLTREGLEALGFFVCVEDLEDELIRALGPEAVEEVVAAEGELHRFRTFQNQPAWRGRPVEDQLRRFMKTYSGRAIRVAARLTEALDPAHVPRPLAGVLAYVSGPAAAADEAVV